MAVTFVSTVQIIDPQQAEIWLANPYKHQRPIDPRHVNDLARAMSEGRFSPTNFIMLSGKGGHVHLLNGRHTCLAIIKSQKSQTLTVNFYTVDTDEEEAELYIRTDRPRKRTFADSIRATDIPNILGLTPTMIQESASALRFIKSNFGASRASDARVSDDELIEWLPLWAWQTKAIHKAIAQSTGKERSLVLRMAVMSVALITMHSDHVRARDFWGQVAKDDGLERFDPRKTLRMWLIEARNQSVAPGARIRNPELARGAIMAWNAFTEGRHLRFIKVVDNAGIVTINETDYYGGQGPDYLPLYPSENEKNG